MSFFTELQRRNVFRIGAAYTVVAWLTIQVVATIFPAFGFGDAATRIVTIMLAIGLIPALILAWVYELTSEGLKKDKDVDQTQSITRQTGKKLDRFIIVLLAMALGYFALDKWVLSPQRQATELQEARQEGRSEALVDPYGQKSIAVLPFVDMSPEGDQEYFSDGIAEELLNLLAKIPELRVVSRSSAFTFKDQNLEIPEIAKRLNVAHILEGSVRKAGNQIRITAQLIDAPLDTHIWSETYDHTLDDIFAVQDEISAQVVEQLKVTLLGAAAVAEQSDPRAYALFLQARHVAREGTPKAYEQAIELYEQALAISSEYLAAMNGLASVYASQAANGLRTYDEGFSLARKTRLDVLGFDPNNIEALSGLGWIALAYDDDLAAAAQYYQQALAYDPNNFSALNGAANLAMYFGQKDAAVAIHEYIVVRDPISPGSHANMGVTYLHAGDLDSALASFRTVLSLSPRKIAAQYMTGEILLLKGHPEAALAAFTLEGDDEYRTKGLALAFHTLGRQAEHEAAFTELRERWGGQWPTEVAHVFAWIGDVDSAFSWLEKDLGNTGGWGQTPSDPLLVNLHDDPRWQPLLKKAGVSTEQMAAIQFEVTVPE